MASFRELRPKKRLAEAGRVRARRHRSSVLFTATVALVAIAALLLAQLAGRPEREGNGPTPAFLTKALGAPQASAPLVRKPRPGVTVRIDGATHAVELDGRRYSLKTVGSGSARWRAHVNGASRPTPFGSETVTITDERTEQFLTVTRKQGQRTWRWQLGEGYVPRVAPNGTVGLLADHQVAPVEIDPVAILDEDGRHVTPAGVRWSVAKRAGRWNLELRLDDATLPTPYVIDPAFTWRTAQSANNGTTSNFIDLTVPATAQAGDLLVAVMSVKGAATITEPAGWTMRSEQANTVRIGVYYRVAIAGDDGDTFRWNLSGVQQAVGGISVYYGLKTSSPTDANGTAGTGNGANISAPQVTTAANDSIVIAGIAMNTAGGATQAAGWTEQLEANTSGSTGSFSLQDKIQVTAGATGNAAVTGPGGRWVAHQSAYRVDDVVPTPGTHNDPGANLSGNVAVSISGMSDDDSGIRQVQFQHCLQPCGTWTNSGAADTSTPYSVSWDTTTVADGLYDLRAVVTDWAGTTANTAVVAGRRVDNAAPNVDAVTFPTAAAYRSATWATGCPSTGFCGTASDTGGSGLLDVQLSIRQVSTNLYWNGSTFGDASENWRTANSTSSWDLGFLAGNFPADGDYVLRARARDNANNVDATPASITFTYDNTAPGEPTLTATSPASPANDNDPEITGSAEAGATVKLYTNATCSSTVAATGTAAAFNSPGLTAGVAANSTTTFYATATDAAGNASACSTATVSYVEDSAAPSAPSITSSSPASPANDNDPELTGSAEAASTVRIYTNSDCTSAVAASGSAATFGGAGLTVSVANNSTTNFYATATDAANNASTCSATPFTYVEESFPPAPTGLATTPASPANDNNPEVTGNAQAGSTVRIYTTSDCSGAAAASGTAADFSSPGLTVNVGDDTTTTFYATATTAGASPCSTGVTYVEDSTAPAAPSALSSTPGSPATDNDPEITGSAEAGSTVRLYTTSDCSGAPVATGGAVAFATPGFTVNVAADSSTTFKATATDAAGNPSSCSSAYTYVEDSTAPSAPSALTVAPTSPANDNDPEIGGSVEAGATVRVFTSSDCSGAPAASGTAAAFTGAGISVNVADNSTTTFRATATDAAGNPSTCSSGDVAYVEDSTAPNAPSGLATSPSSPSSDNDPEVLGAAEAGSTVRIYTTNDCSGAPVATGSSATFGGGGLAVNVGADSTTTFYANARDAANNTSACSTGVTYVEDSTAPATPSALASTPGSPANDNDPELGGTAEAGSTVRIYTTGDCSGAPVATGNAATFGGAGLSVNVGNDTTTTFKATATDAAGNPSTCSTGILYVEDSTAPSAPTGLTTAPASPANDNNPAVRGTAEAGATVRAYTTSDCSGAAAATGSAATFAAAGLTVNVANDSSTTFKATATDAAGNPSGCSAGVAYVEDSIDPTSSVGFPSAGGAYTASSWNDFSGTAGDGSGSGVQRVELSIRRDSSGLYWNGSGFASATEEWRSASGTTSWSLSFAVANFAADGDYTVRVRAVDEAANTQSPSTRGFSIDRAAPETQVDSGPTDPSNDANPSFSFSADDGAATFQCQLNNGGWAACTSPKSYSSLSEGSYTFEVRARDAAGNVDGSPATRAWTLDRTDPVATFSVPAAGASYNTAGWNTGCSPSGICGTATESGGAGLQRVEVSIKRDATGLHWDGSSFSSASEDWRTATGTAAWNLAFGAATFPADGGYTVRVRARDNAGNVGAPSSRTFSVDTVAPETQIDTGPSGNTNDNDPSFTFSASQTGSTFQCRLDGGSWGACTSPKSYTNVADGSHTFDVRATDPGGNTDATPASRALTIDTVPPSATMDNPGPYLRQAVTLTASTSDPGGTGIASLTFERSAAGSGGPWTAIPATWDTTTAPDGLYDLHVVAVDNATNATTSSAVTNVRVDNTPPNAVLDDPGAAVSGTVSLTHSSSDGTGSGIDTVQFQYRASPAGTWENTGTAWDTTALTDGDFELRVVIHDRAGNESTSPVRTTRVDNTDPNVSFAAPTAGGYLSASAPDPFTARANADDAGGSGVANVEFWACDNTSAGCASGSWTSLGTDSSAPYEASWPLPGTDGNRALRTRATDNAGRTRTVVIDVTIDRLVPDTNLLSNPGNPSNNATPAFTFSSNEGGATFECRIDAGAWAACTSPHTTAALADGTRMFEVRARDTAGNIDGSPASWTWLVDTTDPVATMNDPGANLRLAVGLTSSESDPGGANASGIAAVEYQYSAANANTWVATPALWDTQAVSDGLYDVRVVVTDVAGNVGEAVPVEDRRVDNSAPATSIDDPGANIRQTVTLTGAATDTGGSGVQQVEFQISPVGAASWSTVGSAGAEPYQVALNTTAYADGLYDFRTVATDVAGNRTEGTAVVSRRIDNTPPTATMNDPGANLRGTVNLTSVADDPGGSGVSTVAYEYSPAGGGAWQSASAAWATTSVADGVYDLRVVVRDVAGNETISLPVANRRVDNTKPQTTDNAPAGWQASAVTVTLSANDFGGSGVSNTQYSVDGGGFQSGTSVTIASDGIHTISYFSTDVVGNVESPRTATVMIDTTPPDPGANDPGNYLRGTVTLSANPNNGGGGADILEVEFQRSPEGANSWTTIGVDNTGPGPYTASWATTPADDGRYDLRFIVREDTVPPRSTSVDMASKIVDNTAPSASVGSPLNGAVVSGGVTIGPTVFDDNPIATVEHFVRGASIGVASSAPFQRTWNSASSADGPAQIYIVATDMAGNSTTSAAVTVTADNFAPSVSLANPGAAVRGTVTLSASADGDATQVTFDRRPSSGGSWTTIATDNNGAPWTADFVTTSAPDGDYDLRAIAVDAGGNAGTSATRTTRVDNTNPTGALTRPGDGARVGGSSVALEATANDPGLGSGVASVTWQYRQTGSGGGYTDIASDGSPPYAATWDVTALPSVAHDLRIVVTDVAGNAFATNPISVDVDSTAPTVTLNDPGSPLAGTVSLSASTTGDATAVTFAYSPAGAATWTTIATDGSSPYSASFNTTTLSDGVYDLRAVVTDAVGNTSTSTRGGIRIDNFVPVIVSSVPAHGSIVASASSISITSSEPIASLTGVTLDGAAAPAPVVTGASAAFNTGPLSNGSHTLAGTVADAAGKSSSFSISFVVGLGPAPAVDPVLPFEPLPLVPAPTDFRGVIEADGTLTLLWTPAKDDDGTPLATILLVDGNPVQSLAPGESGVNLGPFDAADMRIFAIASVGPDGVMGVGLGRLRSTSALRGKPLADVEAILVNRGFELGTVTGSGSVVVKPVNAQMATVGEPVDVELGEPEAPQTRLLFSAVGTTKYSWKVTRHIAVRTQVTRAAHVTAALVSPSGRNVYRWRFEVKAGTSIVRLTMPPQVRRPGKYRLVLTVRAGRETVRRTLVVEVAASSKPSGPTRKPIEVVLADTSHSRRDIEVGLQGQRLRVVTAGGTDDTFNLTGATSRNVQVVVVDVDRYGVALVRDLRTVFPTVKIIALTNDPRKLAQSMRGGATIAVPRSTPPRDLAKLIAQLARR